MRIGDLKHRITIQAPTRVPDGMGNTDNTWTDRATIYAAIWPVSAKEQIASMGLVLTMTHRIRIRYRSDIKSDWRLKYKNSLFNIVSIVNPNMENRMLDIIVKAV